MKLQDLHVEPLFESEFVLVANRARIGNGTVRLASLQHEPVSYTHLDVYKRQGDPGALRQRLCLQR